MDTRDPVMPLLRSWRRCGAKHSIDMSRLTPLPRFEHQLFNRAQWPHAL